MKKAKSRRAVPVVFISSTYEDLKQYRAEARDAALQEGFFPVMQEYFVSGPHDPLPVCLGRVEEADVVVVIAAHRYGWVPEDQPGDEAKSITWLECSHSAGEGKDLLVFTVDPKCEWPPELYEGYSITEAIYQRKATPELLARLQSNVENLDEFKKWLDRGRTRRTFDLPGRLRAEVGAALRKWLTEHPDFAAEVRLHDTSDPRAYLEILREQTAWINIRGLQVGSETALRVPIGEIYIPLTMAGGKGDEEAVRRRAKSPEDEIGKPHPTELEQALVHPRLVIVGDPGSGKSTFLQRVAFALAEAALADLSPSRSPAKAESAAAGEGPSFFQRMSAAMGKDRTAEDAGAKSGPARGRAGRPLPVLIRVADLADHIRKRRDAAGYQADAPAWLADFLSAQSEGFNWGLSETFFRRQLEGGSLALLLDGLDEASGRAERVAMARLFEHATRAYKSCRFVVTTRPLSYAGEATLAGFDHAVIEPLPQAAAEKFLTQWCGLLYPKSQAEAARHLAELLDALRIREEIRRMAQSPVMLTALAVVHWNQRRLPEQRAELYRSILNWLAVAREGLPGREPAARTLTLLQQLALVMQGSLPATAGDGERHVQTGKGRAAEILAPQFSGTPAERQAGALAFLDRAEQDSGIIVSRAGEVRFLHLTFQEYLAARAIAGLPDEEQRAFLIGGEKIYRPEWREVMLLLGGVLMEQGRAKVDGLVAAILEQLGATPALPDRARCAGLIGSMALDLRPLDYQVRDARYRLNLNALLPMFEPAHAQSVDLQVRLEAAEALGREGDPRLKRDNWVTIPAGSFLMGAQKKSKKDSNYDAEANKHGSDESPVHEVFLRAFRMGRYPVTVEEYRRFMEDKGYENKTWWKAGAFGQRTGPERWEDQLLHPNRPVTGVTWYEAAAWCAWAGGRLPTEAEWERAARGTGGRRYPWSNEEPDANTANYMMIVGHATPVGLFPKGMTPQGLHDMAGNVWEWCSDWYSEDYYGKSPKENPQGPKKGSSRVLRGGSWYVVSFVLRAAVRYSYAPDDWDVSFGFRCVREVLP